MTATVDLGFIHQFTPGNRSGAPSLLLLHGTGGSEDDLLTFGAALAPGAPLLSPRGKISENGMPRFFRRLAPGVLDLKDLRFRTGELADFVGRARDHYHLDLAPWAAGLSNGANIAAAMLLLRPGTLGGALLLRPMVPLVPDVLPDLNGIPVQIVAGRADPVVSTEQSEALAELLRECGAQVQLDWLPGGHRLTRADLEIGARWFGLSSLSRTP
jgi:phospholipase/carboxylesterase